MNFPQKITLENSIFARAEKLHVQVHARAGRLLACCEDRCLKTLLCVYNAFFCRENWESFCAWESELEGLSGFETQVMHTPVLSAKEYRFEFIVGGKHA